MTVCLGSYYPEAMIAAGDWGLDLFPGPPSPADRAFARPSKPVHGHRYPWRGDASLFLGSLDPGRARCPRARSAGSGAQTPQSVHQRIPEAEHARRRDHDQPPGVSQDASAYLEYLLTDRAQLLSMAIYIEQFWPLILSHRPMWFKQFVFPSGCSFHLPA